MPRDQQDILRRNIRALLKERGMNLKGLANLSTVASGTLYNFFKEVEPTVLGEPSQLRIANAFGVTLDELRNPALAHEDEARMGQGTAQIKRRLDRMGEEERDEAIAMVEAILDAMDARKKRSGERHAVKAD